MSLQDNEQYRLQMAGISTAALGYWKEGDSIHPDYDTMALRDVAKLYAKYDALFQVAIAAERLAEESAEDGDNQVLVQSLNAALDAWRVIAGYPQMTGDAGKEVG